MRDVADDAGAQRVVYDSESVEKPFAQMLEEYDFVKVYAKLPRWFRVHTPLGDYNPDWAVLVEVKGRKRLYFVAETKPSQLMPELRPREEAKIACGRRHFDTLSDQMPEPIRFGTYSDPEQFVGDVADEG